MANYTAADVKRLREDTDAPMMECKSALEEADGDFDKAKDILKQKGKAAAGKRADRTTAAGVVAIALSESGHEAGVAVMECETDFVSRNADFITLAQTVANAFRDADPGANPEEAVIDGSTVKELMEQAVGKFRENIKLTKGLRISSANHLVTYIHHDNAKGSVVELKGETIDREVARKVANQVVAFPPEVLRKEDLSQDRLAKEIEIQTRRAIDEGKPENIAKQIAEGRVNKEFVREAALLEQAFYADPSKTVAQYLKENGGLEAVSFLYARVGG